MTYIPDFSSVPQALQLHAISSWDKLSEHAKQEICGLAPEVMQSVPRLFAVSDFIPNTWQRDLPSLGVEISLQYTLATYQKLIFNSLQDVNDEIQLKKVLRQVRNREMLKIAWCELSNWINLEESLQRLSDFAEAVIVETLSRLYAWQCARLGFPQNHRGEVQKMYVIAVGKLGGHELNFSSDIDLIFCYPEDGYTQNQQLDNQQFFTRLSQQFIKVLSDITEDGFVFRVDTRLRPYGESGRLIMNFNAFERYYLEQGRDWERYALIKARVIGEPDNNTLILEKLVSSFVYRRYIDYSVIESMRGMKQLLVHEAKSKALDRNIKKGSGGIREIEFITQCFQLIRGGRDVELQEQQIFRVFILLKKWHCLNDDVVLELQNAYVFLRKLENRLQMLADQQTHDLPTNKLAQLRIAYAMGYNDWLDLDKEWRRHKLIVQKHFRLLIAKTDADTLPPLHNQFIKTFKAIWANPVDDEVILKLLTQHGFDDAKTVWQVMLVLRNSHRYHTLSHKAQQRLDTLLPYLLLAAAKTTNPVVSLQRSMKVVDTIILRSVYLSLLIENPSALQHLVNLCSASSWIAEYLMQYPLLLDELLDNQILSAPSSKSDLRKELDRELTGVMSHDLELWMDTLRRFHHIQMLRVARADVASKLPLMKVSDHLTFTAEVILDCVFKTALDQVIQKFGEPKDNHDKVEPIRFIIVGYGKLGGLELGYGSDLDLVFLFDGTDGQFYARLAQRIIHLLSTRTSTGVIYKVDLRLRPSGDSGLLVNHLVSFSQYQQGSAWTWEHQALVRARVICGDKGLSEQFISLRKAVLTKSRESLQLREDVFVMREKMRVAVRQAESGVFDIKNSPGGMIDIEFIVQYLALLSAVSYPEVIYFTDNIRILDSLSEYRVVTAHDATALQDAYRAFRGAAHRCDLQNIPALIADDNLNEHREKVLAIWQKIFNHYPQSV